MEESRKWLLLDTCQLSDDDGFVQVGSVVALDQSRPEICFDDVFVGIGRVEADVVLCVELPRLVLQMESGRLRSINFLKNWIEFKI